MYKEIESLEVIKRGSIVRHSSSGDSYIVESGYDNNLTAIRSICISNPSEWDFEKFSDLEIGSTVRHQDDINQIVITNTFGNRAIGVSVVEISNTKEWLVYSPMNL